jgi:hypothetical protein
MDKIKHTEGSICDLLNDKYTGNCRYKVANIYVFKGNWESDFFVQKDNGYTYEFEVKVSRSDFLSDKKKVQKHSILQTGKYTNKSTLHTWNKETRQYDKEDKIQEIEHAIRPHKFFYVVPGGMVTVEEVPSYAGLMYATDTSIETIKEAPFLHKETLNLGNRLCPKFYSYWIIAKQKIRSLEMEIEYLKEKNTKQ